MPDGVFDLEACLEWADEALRRAITNDPWGTDHARYRDALTEALAALSRVEQEHAEAINGHSACVYRAEAAEAEAAKLREAATRVVDVFTAEAEDHNDGEFALWEADDLGEFALWKAADLLNAIVALRAALGDGA